jgi:hypothetical protein
MQPAPEQARPEIERIVDISACRYRAGDDGRPSIAAAFTKTEPSDPFGSGQPILLHAVYGRAKRHS